LYSVCWHIDPRMGDVVPFDRQRSIRKIRRSRAVLSLGTSKSTIESHGHDSQCSFRRLGRPRVGHWRGNRLLLRVSLQSVRSPRREEQRLSQSVRRALLVDHVVRSTWRGDG